MVGIVLVTRYDDEYNENDDRCYSYYIQIMIDKKNSSNSNNDDNNDNDNDNSSNRKTQSCFKKTLNHDASK